MRLTSLSGAFSAFTCALLTVTSVKAVSFPIFGRPRSPVSSLLGKRTVNITSFGNGSTSVRSDEDNTYSTNITLGGKAFEVEIDTGSSTLWVKGDVPRTKNLSIPDEIHYGKGSARGFMNTVDMVFDDFTIKDQAYLNVIQTSDLSSGDGILGLGPSATLERHAAKVNSTLATPLERIFRQNTSTPNFISVLLTRMTDERPGGTAPQAGQLTIGSVIPTLENITKQTKLPALRDSHWVSLLDENGIVGPDGENISTKTTISDPKQGTDNQLHVAFDTGFTYPQVPREIADAIYGRVPGAVFVPQDEAGYWQVPCDYELNVTFSFGGVKYPISPLDLTMPEQGYSSANLTTCISTFQQILPSIANHTEFGAFDAILGMAFLRNTYLMINFGDFIDGSNTSVADPYIQLLSVTDPAAAHTDFVNVRLGGVDKTGSQPSLLSMKKAKHSPKMKNKVRRPFYKTLWFIIVISVAGAILLASISFCACWRIRTRRSKIPIETGFRPTMVGATSYAPLLDPVSRQQGARSV